MMKINYIVLQLISLLGLIQPVRALTVADIKVEVRRYINDKADPRIKVTDAAILTLINETQREIVNQTWCLTNRTTTNLTVNTTYYSLPNDMLAINHVEFKDSVNRTRELTEVSEKGNQQNNPDYERQVGPPMQYFVRDSTSSTITTLQISYLPVPNTASSTGTVNIDYFNQAVDLSGDTDVPFDSLRYLYPYHYTIVYGVVGKIKLMQNDPAAATFIQLEQASTKLMMDRLGRMPNYAPGFSPATTK